MHILLDEYLPRKLASELKGHEVETVSHHRIASAYQNKLRVK